MKRFMNYLKLPEAQELKELNGFNASLLHAKIIQKKPFLKKLYVDFYQEFKRRIPGDINSKFIVELGSGGGFIKEVMPTVLTSDVLPVPHIDECFSALKMPFENDTVDAFLMLNVFHHVKDAESFLREIERCLKDQGRVIMIEPANTLWSSWIWRNFHHEPFDPQGKWSIEGDDPLFSANEALPWIVFCRDRKYIEKRFTGLKILDIKLHTPFLYLISGGVSMKQLLPTFIYNIVRGFEKMLAPLIRYLGMFMTIEIEKQGNCSNEPVS